jgi:uncharacterized membrane protein
MKRLPHLLAFLFLVGAWVLALIAYPHMPESIASHWGASGEANGYVNRFWGTFFPPILMTGLYLLFVLVPNIDPRRENIRKFRRSYDYFLAVLLFFLLCISGYSLAWNLGHHISMSIFLSPTMAILFFAVGTLTGNAEPNYMIGIRTPWTLSSDTVWRKTHHLGGRAFQIASLFCLLGTFFPKASLWFILLPILAATLLATIASYVYYVTESR